MHAVLHALLQHTPSTHWPLKQSLAVTQSEPRLPGVPLLLDALLAELELLDELPIMPLEETSPEDELVIPPAPAVPPDEPDDTVKSGAHAEATKTRVQMTRFCRIKRVDMVLRYA